MRKNSKDKGNRFERVVANWWKKWTGYEFARTPGSGGWAKKSETLGDLTCTDAKHSKRFPFTVECKFYQDIRFEHLLLGNKNTKIIQFWEQATTDATRGNKVPILMMRYNGISKDEFFIIVDHIMAEVVLELNPKKPWMSITINPDSDPLYIFMASDLINMDYQRFYKHGRTYIKENLI